MKFRFLAAAAAFSLGLMGAASVASAQDAPGDFSGGYVGVIGGVDFGHAHYSLPGDTGDALKDPNAASTSLQGGVVAGFNHQMGDVVLGLEADVTAGGGALRATACTVPDGCFTPTHDSFTTFNKLNPSVAERVRVRAGVVRGGTLFYVAGGFSGEHAKMSLVGDCFNAANPNVPLVFTFDRAKQMSGFNVGFGAERPMGRHLMVRAEAVMDDYGEQKFAGAAPEWNDRRIHVTDAVARVAVSYRF
jgi:outer membrane immunogenic protein